MLLLSEYNILETISSNNHTLLYRAERSRDRKKVILKILETTNAKIERSEQFANEYAVAGNFLLKGIARYLKLETYNNQPVVVMEDIEGISLKNYLKDHIVDISNALKIAIGISEILQHLYHKGFVHQDLCPAHLLVNPETYEVNLIDFSLASRVSNKHRTIENPHFLKGSLDYISPEQTGRIKGEIDFRSDLYSFGIILYELVTGHLPFESTESLSLIHCHIAKNPVPPHVINPQVPVALSQIIVKLLSKNPGDRYQSPFGLRVDLQTCLTEWISSGCIELFELGQRDFSGIVQNPTQFYGREKETGLLQQSFKRITQGGPVQLVLVEGYSGIGKSALVHKLKDFVRVQGGIFVEGKFNQFQRNTPYFAFIQAFKEFTDYVLRQGTDVIATWKEQILNAVGVNGKVLTDIIPHLELLIGQQPALPELESKETQNRFHYVFINFIECIAQEKHPLVIFFDDLQWSDAASSGLLKIISINKDLRSFLFVGVYRENEIAANSTFSATMEEVQKEGCLVQKIILSPLPHENVEDIIGEMLKGRVQNYRALVELVYNKSQGNPFFISAFLKYLYEENILVFDFYNFTWNWDPAKINELRYTENIVQLMTGRIQKLPPATQHVLKIAACLGYNFDVQILMIVLQETRQVIAGNLNSALAEDLLFSVGDNYCFMHDRIQQAAYCLIPENEKKNEHLRIGKSLLKNLDGEAHNTYIFEIVNQLNIGSESIVSQEEKIQLARLNLTAGIKAKSSAAYKPSFEYLNTGINLLPAQTWEHHYELILHLYTEGAESGFLSGNNDLMEEWIELVLRNASNVLDKVSVYEIRIKSYVAQQKLLDALYTAEQVLELLHVRFPKNPGKTQILVALLQIKMALLQKPVKTQIDAPLIKNPIAEAAIRVLISVGAAVYFARPSLLPMLKCKLFYLMIRYGNSQYSGVICYSYSLMLIAGLGNYNEGYEIGKIAAQLSEKFEVSSLKCQSIMMENTFIKHWKEHMKNTLEPLVRNYWYGLENGNIEYATYSALVYSHNAFFCGRNLKNLNDDVSKYCERIKGLRHESAFNLHSMFAQAVINLSEEVESPAILSGRVHNEEKMVYFYKQTKGETALYKIYLYKLIISYLFEQYNEAYQNAAEARTHLKSVPGSSEFMIFFFYDTLIKLSVFPKTSWKAQKSLLIKIDNNIRTFSRFTRAAPMNCQHKLFLIKAELYRVTGRPEKAALLYDKAIEEAIKNEYINDAALACDLAGRFYNIEKRKLIAEHYLLQAYKFYQHWGALNKVKDMEQKYAFLFEQQQLENQLNNYTWNRTQYANPALPAERDVKELDLQSVLGAAAAISSEVQLDRLLKKLVKIAVENTGAQQGYLILVKESAFFIEAESSIEVEEQVILESVPIKENEFICEAIVQFAYHTQENLVIENAAQHPNFCSESVIKKNGSKSVLCMPIIHQGNVIGLLYFENNLIINAFTNDRIELLKLLSGQMAISLQNALNEQKKMNVIIEREKLLEKINVHQQELLKTKIEIQEQTFNNISGEIHDNIGQTLSFIKLNINTIDTGSPEVAKEKLLESKNLLTKVIQDLRDLAKTLNTDFIAKQGLTNAIDQQLQFLKRAGLYTVRFLVSGDISRYESQSELVIFRIVQELLNNVVKHAEATAIYVEMQYKEEKLIITVQDNGKGFDVEKQHLPDNKGLGLRNIHNRLALVKGSIVFNSQLQKGTTATIELMK